MKIGVIGTGAVGGYYGSLLARNGFEVHFLLNSDYQYVMHNGLVIESKDGDFALESVNAYSHSEEMPKCDLVIVSLKTTHNNLLKTILPDTVKAKGVVVVLQNGLGIEEHIAEIVPTATIIGGLCFLCSNKIGPGHIRHLDYGSIRLGQYRTGYNPAGVTHILKETSEIFSKASISVRLSDHLGKARWEKLVWNMAFNGTTVVLNATTDRIMANNSSRTMVKEIMLEVIRGARVCGFEIEDEFADIMLTATRQMVEYRPSMKLDFESGRPLEIADIYWHPIQIAEKNGYEMHKAKVLAYQLDYLDQVNIKK